MKTKVRLLPVFKPGKEHSGHVDGWIVHPEDRIVRVVKVKRERAK